MAKYWHTEASHIKFESPIVSSCWNKLSRSKDHWSCSVPKRFHSLKIKKQRRKVGGTQSDSEFSCVACVRRPPRAPIILIMTRGAGRQPRVNPVLCTQAIRLAHSKLHTRTVCLWFVCGGEKQTESKSRSFVCSGTDELNHQITIKPYLFLANYY